MSPHLQHLAWTIARCLSGMLGFAFLYMALFMYQDERGKQQNRLVNLWLSAQTRQESALSLQSELIRAASRLATIALQKLLGTRLFSVRAAAISLSLSISSGLLVTSATGLFPRHLAFLAAGVIFGIYGFFAGPHLFNRARTAQALLLLALLCLSFYAGAYLGLAKGHYETLINDIVADGLLLPGSLLLSCLFGLLCDLLLLAVNRRILDAMSKTRSTALLGAGFFYNLVWTLVLADSILFVFNFWNKILVQDTLRDPIALTVKSLIERGALHIDALIVILGAFSTNLFTMLTASSVVLILLIALLHRFTWPLVGRTLNALYEWELLSSRKLQFSAATAFLLFSLPRLFALFSPPK